MALIASALEHGDYDTALPLLESMSRAQLSQLILPDQRTPLHYACQHGRVDVAERLISKWSIAIDKKDVRGCTPLHVAAQYGQLDVVKYLLYYNLETPLEMKPMMLRQNILPIHRVAAQRDSKSNTPLDIACIYGNLNIVHFFIEEIRFNPTKCLQLAAVNGHFPLVRYLVEKDVYSNSKLNISNPKLKISSHVRKSGGSNERFLDVVESLYAVAATAYLDILQYMVETYELHPKFTMRDDFIKRYSEVLTVQRGMSLLHQACQADLRVVKYLTDYGCEPSLQDEDGVTPLHLACEHGHLDIAKYLIEIHGCFPSCDVQGITPLYLACKKGCLDIVLYLVTEVKCDTKHISKHGESYLHAASRSGNLDIMKLLINRHGCVFQQDPHSKSPLSSNERTGVENCDLGFKDDFGRTPLHYASQKGSLEIVMQLVETYHCDPMCKDGQDSTPLEWASCNGRFEIVKYLTSLHQCTPKKKCVHCNLSLHLAAQEGHLEIVKFFIEEMKCDPDCRARWNKTLLHAASIDGHIDVIKYLVEECNGDPACLDVDGNTPMHLACVKDQVSVVKYFITKLHRFSLTEVENVHGLNVHGKPGLYRGSGKISSFLDQVFSKIPVRVFVLGNSGAGKSTLIKAITSPFHVLGRIVKVKHVPPQTAGVVPLTFYSEDFGKVKFYDFAGHEEYYASHEIILQNSDQSLIFMTVNVSLPTQEIQKQLLYWHTILSNSVASTNSKDRTLNLHIIVIGSYADKVDDTKVKEVQKLASELMDEETNLSYHGFISCDCRYSISSNMKQLTCKLNDTCKIIRANISLLETDDPHQFYEFLNETLQTFFIPDVFISIGSLMYYLTFYRNYRQLYNKDLLKGACVALHNNGQILLIPDQKSFDNSLLVLKEDAFFSQVHGCLKHIKDCFSNNFGILKQSDLEKVSSSLLPLIHLCQSEEDEICNLVLKYFEFTQLCTAISARKLTLGKFENTTYYFFPNLVLASRPKDLSMTNRKVYTGFYTWCLRCSNILHFFTPKFIHTLFIQIVKCEPDTEHSKYVIWRNGILLVHSNGTRSIIEVTDQTTRLYLSMQCVKGFELHLVKQRSRHILLLKSLAHKVCPKVELSEVLLRPHDCYPPENTTEISMNEIARSAVCSYPFVVSGSSEVVSTALQQIQLSDLVFFDSLHALDESSVKEVYVKKDSGCLVPPDILTEVCKSVGKNRELRTKLQREAELSYSQLFVELHKYTVFPDADIFAVAGIDLQDCVQIEQAFFTTDFYSYVSALPPYALPHLELQLDWDHEGVERDLGEVADHMLDWEEKLSANLGLTPVEISDIKEIHMRTPALQRRAALRRWQSKQGLCATYGNLLKLLADAGHKLAADGLSEILRKKRPAPGLDVHQ